MDAVAPGLLVAQTLGRIGNYFNQSCSETRRSCLGGSTSPGTSTVWLGEVATFQPTFLNELIFDLALAALLIMPGRTGRSRAPGLSAYTSPAALAFGSSKSWCASTPCITSWDEAQLLRERHDVHIQTAAH